MLYLPKKLSFSKNSITSRSFKIICFAIVWNLNFAVNLVTLFSRQKTLKSKNKKILFFGNTKFDSTIRQSLISNEWKKQK